MSEIENVLNGEKSEAEKKKSFAEEMKARVNALYAKSDEACLNATKTAKEFKAMIDIASKFTRYSESNILLVYAQRPDAQQIDSFNDWRDKGASVRKGSKGIHIVVRKDYTNSEGKKLHCYNDETRFDISDVEKAPEAEAKVYDEKQLMKALVHSAPVQIIVDAEYPEDKPEGAYFDAKTNSIHCQYGMTFKDMFTSIAKAAAHSELSKGDVNYRNGDGEFAARSITYMLASKYGVSTDLCQILSVPASYQSFGKDEAKAELYKIIGSAKTLDLRMSQVLDRPKQQNKEAVKEGETKADNGKTDSEKTDSTDNKDKTDKEDAR